jgi:hypothetical protein
MADISDVEQAVADSVTAILYPAGTDQSSVIGALCRIYRGWPNAATLNPDLSAGAVNITITIDNDSGRTTTRYLQEWQTKSAQPGVAAIASAQAITISGAPAAGDLVGAIVDGKSFVYRVRAGDNPELVASNLGGLVRETRVANVHQATVNIPGAMVVKVRTTCDNAAFTESRRQEKDLRIAFWCPTPEIRDSITAAVDLAIDRSSFVSLPDGTQARIVYRNTSSYDQAQSALLYRRDLIYTIEYPTVSIVQQPSMIFGAAGINGHITYG